MIKVSVMNFRHKEVININNKKRLGLVQDACANLETGRITSIIVSRNKNHEHIFKR